MKKSQLIIISIVEIILICLLSVFFTFKTICIRTISENYMNTTITNQIIDFVIDHYTDIKNEQLISLQNDLNNSDALYYFNQNAFDTAIKDIKEESDFQMEEETIDRFSLTCIEMMESHLNCDLNDEEQQKVISLLQKDSLWTRFLQNLNTKIDKDSFFVKIYSLSDMVMIKIILVLAAAGLFIYLMVKAGKMKIICIIGISLSVSLINYLMLAAVYLLTPLLSSMINIENLRIVMDPVLYVAMLMLSISLIFICILIKSGHFERI